MWLSKLCSERSVSGSSPVTGYVQGWAFAIIAPLISSVCEGDGKDTEELQFVSTLPCSLLNHECSMKENPDKETLAFWQYALCV